MERSLVPSMDLSKPSTHANLEAAFGGESMANRKYLFFSEVAKQLGHRLSLIHISEPTRPY